MYFTLRIMHMMYFLDEVEDKRWFFRGDFNDPDVETWDTGHSTDMREMFRDASSFNQPLSGWDVSSVENMKTMFFIV